MWTIYKTKQGDTMDTIIVSQKIKDPATVLTHKDNKKIYKDLKAGKELPKGTKVTIPDPKGKVYVVQTKSGVKYMNEKAYKEYLKVIHEKMDEAVFGLKQRITYATGRHDAQKKINDDQWFVAFCIDVVNSVPEPKSRKQAESAFAKAEKAAKARNYKAFEKSLEPANIAIATYKNEVLCWIDGIINAGESTIDKLEGVKTVGMVCGAVAATTVIAPVGLAAGTLTGAMVGGGTSLAYDGFDSIGRAIAGSKQRSTSETLKRAAGGALAGAAGAAVVGTIMKFAGPAISKIATGNKVIEAQVKRVLGNSKLNLKTIYDAELKAMGKKLGFKSMEGIQVIEDAVMGKAMTKLLLRVTAGSLNKLMETGTVMKTYVIDWIAGDSKRVSGSDPSKTAQAFAKDFAKSSGLDDFFDKIVADNMSAFKKLLQAELKTVLLAEMKKQKA